MQADNEKEDEKGRDTENEIQQRSSTPELLAGLLSSLAVGARAAQGLPTNTNMSNEEQTGDNEFDFQRSLPEFSRLLNESQDSLLLSILPVLEEFCTEDVVDYERNMDDPLLWDACADACDALVEQVEAFLASDATVQDMTSTNASDLSKWSKTARQRAQSSFGRLLDGIVDMPKPQDVHQIRRPVPLNDRTTPFVPPISEKHNASAAPLDLSLAPGHGLDTRFGPARTVLVPSSVVAPAHHVGHVYQAELDSLVYPPWQLDQGGDEEQPDPIPIVDKLEATWVDSPQALNELSSLLENVRHVAIDLEAHSHRSFAGITCLIQISVFTSELPDADGAQTSERITNFLIDPFPLWSHLSSALGPTFSNPDVVKIFHGADSDVQWLQRDFGLFIVNLFDTGRAARALKFNSAGYAHLLLKYAKVNADKSHQLADWRQRPLPEAMRHYAIMDTHYLLDIYRHLRHDIYLHKDVTLEEVLEQSRLVTLVRYAPEPFKPDAYVTLIQKRASRERAKSKSIKSKQSRTELNDTQEGVLRELYDWRDATARQNDESLFYVCPNQSMVRLALACPSSLSVLQGLLNPVPPLVLKHANEIINIIARTKSQETQNKAPSTSNLKPRPATTTTVPSSAFFKPALSPTEEVGQRSRLLSPVLGTEALYMQAGWMTPQNQDGPDYDANVEPIVTTTDDDEKGDEDNEKSPGKPNSKSRNVLAVHQANQSNQTNQFASHSLQMGKEATTNRRNERPRPRSVDGMGSARAAYSQSPLATASQSIEKDAEVAQQTAAHIRSNLSREELISPTTEIDEDEIVDVADVGVASEGRGPTSNAKGEMDMDTESDFVIPRSMREIYQISNRNRGAGKNKKASYPISDRGSTPPNEKEAEELAKAEEVLKSRGLDFITGSPKRQRTKSVGTASMSSEDAQMNDSGSISREDDIGLMQEIGWIKDKAEVEGMLNQRRSTDGDDGPDQGEDESDDEGAPGSAQNKPSKPSFGYGVGNFGPSTAQNPFFAGAATPSSAPQGKADKKKQGSGRGKPSRRQAERPDKRDGRSQAFKKR